MIDKTECENILSLADTLAGDYLPKRLEEIGYTKTEADEVARFFGDIVHWIEGATGSRVAGYGGNPDPKENVLATIRNWKTYTAKS